MIWVLDSEGDGLNPTKLHCLSVCDPKTGVIHTTADYDKMRKVLTSAKVLIAHNIIRFDIPVFERLLGIKIKARLIDTLALSWYLYPERVRHGLESWGDTFGIKKPFIADWENQSQEDYEHRCEEDVKINLRLWKEQYSYLLNLYGDKDKVWKFLDYLSFKIHCARLQEESKWKLDVDFVSKSLAELEKIKESKTLALTEALPPVPSITVKARPKKFLNKQGDYSKLGQDWIALLTERGLPPTHEEPLEIIKGYEKGNPNSPDQVKGWLYSLGWKPRTFKYVKNDEGGTRAIPQINLEHGKGICGSIKDLYEKAPELELLDGLSVLSHRIGILKGFLRDQEDGWITARISGLTNTLRFQHTELVNLPKIEKLFAEPIRNSLICPEGYVLCGSDKASLEDRIKQHFIFPHDPEYVKSMNTEGFDPHLTVAVIANMCSSEDAETYKWYSSLNDAEKAVADKVRVDIAKRIKPVRDIAKNGNYACQYGAGAPRLVLTCSISLEQAQILHKAYWKLNWAIKEVASEQTVKRVDNQMWLYNPVSGFWYSLRFMKDVFSTLVQGTASYVFDMWVKKFLSKREQLTAQFHDEVVLCIKEGFEKECESLLRGAVKELNEELKLNRELDISVQFGKRYGEIH